MRRSVALTCGAGLLLAACSPGAGGAATNSAPATPKGDGTLIVGTLLPHTGARAPAAAGQVAAVKAAVAQLNAAGGVNGKPVVEVDADAGADPAAELAGVAQLVAGKVDVVIGSPSADAFSKLTAAKAIVLAPTPTTLTASLSLFALAASPTAVASEAGRLVHADGHKSLGVLQVTTDEGKLEGKAVTDAATKAGASLATPVIGYAPDAASVVVEATKIKSGNPDSIVIVGPQQLPLVLTQLQLQRLGPDVVPTYLVGGSLAEQTASVPPAAIKGAKSVQPGAEVTPEFKQQLLAVDPALTVADFAPEAFDATILAALAAQAGGDDDGQAVAAQVSQVSAKGTACTTYAECLPLLKQHKDVNYDGRSGKLAFTEAGTPAQVSIGVYPIGDNGAVGTPAFVTAKP